ELDTMPNVLRMRTYAGAATIGSFFVVSLTGIIMFFHINIGWIKMAHEWMSWVFVAAAVCHAVVHWRSLLGYFRNRAALAVIIPIVIIGLLSLSPVHGPASKHPLAQVMFRLEHASLESVATLTDRDVSEVVRRLKASGITIDTTNQTITEIATRNGRRPTEVLLLLFSEEKPIKAVRHK
ncbi:MAG TPA: DUF4405 domain-containing protein, partial [Thermogutta sp.]|nr:DUF4405 domain-containing protein [Thermogutta sp.]